MATVEQYTLLIYEAVVCNLTLDKMRQDETEKEQEKLLAQTLHSVALSKEVIRLITEADFSNIAGEGIFSVHIALCALLDTTRQTVASTRIYLPAISEKYRSALAAALADLEANTDRLEEIAEGWGLSFDESIINEIKQALSASHKNAREDIPNWRKVLATISD